MAGRHAEATLVVPAGYYWTWSGQFENQQRATARLSWLVPAVLVVCLGLMWVLLIVVRVVKEFLLRVFGVEEE